MKKVAISNIAWPKDSDHEALGLCKRLGFTGVEIAPARTFDDWPEKKGHPAKLKMMLADMGLEIVALQAILFGVDDAQLFQSSKTRARLSDHLSKVADLAGSLGARACVFGAPRNRDPGTLSFGSARAIAVDFLSSIAPVFEAAGSCLTFEANDVSYGCRFITRTSEAVALVRDVNQPGVRAQIDTGTMFLGKEPIAATVNEAIHVAGHVHASEPELRPLGSAGSDHHSVALALSNLGYDDWISVEMRETLDWPYNIERAAKVMRDAYMRHDP